MLKQPKGLIAAALANTGERFGFYTMMAILTLFLMSKFGIDGEQARGECGCVQGIQLATRRTRIRSACLQRDISTDQQSTRHVVSVRLA